MSTYIAKEGDTFERIARIKYGDDQKAYIIRNANPSISGLSDVFGTGVIPEGATIQVPNIRTITPSELSKDKNAVGIKIDDVFFSSWSTFSLRSTIDQLQTFMFTAPFEPTKDNFKKIFQPFSFKESFVSIGDEIVLTGTTVSIEPELTNDSNIVNVSGYSLPGVLNDCTPPVSSYPLQFRDMTLKEIAEKLCQPFGITVTFEDDFGPAFKSTLTEPSKKILTYLASLANDRDLIVTSGPLGDLVFKKLKLDTAEYSINQDDQSVLSISSSFRPQDVYSHITGVKPSVIGGTGIPYTVENKRVDVFRPFTYETTGNVKKADLPSKVEDKARRMYLNAVSFSVKLRGWRTHDGQLWKAGTIVEFEAPRVMVYESTKLVIRSVTLRRSAEEGDTTVLELAYPDIPEKFPWEE